MIGGFLPRSKQSVDEEIAMIERASRKIRRSKKSAREFLIKAGFMTKSGKLTKRYRS